MSSEEAQAAEPCEHVWASHHEPGHAIYWVRQCQVCHAVDWDDLDHEIARLMARVRELTP